MSELGLLELQLATQRCGDYSVRIGAVQGNHWLLRSVAPKACMSPDTGRNGLMKEKRVEKMRPRGSEPAVCVEQGPVLSACLVQIRAVASF